MRTISTKLAISGEAAYKSAISGISTELKTLQSALKLTKSEFSTQANSLEALKAKNDALQAIKAKLVQKISELQKALENVKGATDTYSQKKQELTAKIAENDKALEKLRASTADTSKEEAALVEENKKLNAELEYNERCLATCEVAANKWQTQINGAKIELGNINVEIAKNDQYLDEAANSADECAKSIDRFGNEIKGSAGSVEALTEVMGTLGLVAAMKKAADALGVCVDLSIEFESAMAGVAKTTDLSEQELADMGGQIKELSTQIPLTTTELAKIAEVAGQLGVAKGDLISFTTVMANLGVATNLTSEEAATMLAQFSAIVGMDASFYENLGSTLVALGNNFATNEQRIADMALSIAAAGNNAKMTEAEMFALSTAVTSVGIEAANGGTQMSKLIMQMQMAVETGEDLDQWAAAAGMSAREFSQLWGQDASAALVAFIGNLNNLDASAAVTLKNLGITETRMMRMITSLANAESQTGHLTSAMNTANMAWNQSSALAREASLRYETAESKLKMLSNSANNLGIAVGDKLNPAVKKLAEAGSATLDWMTGVVERSEAIVPLVVGIVAAVAALSITLAAYAIKTKLAAAATTLFNSTLMANPIYAVIAAVAGLAAMFVTAALSADSATVSLKDVTEASQGLGTAFAEADKTYQSSMTSTAAAASVAEQYISKLESLESAGLKTAESQREYHSTLAVLCQVVPELAKYINLETDEIIGGTGALRANTAAWKENAEAQARQQILADKTEAYASALKEVESNSIGLMIAQDNLASSEDEIARITERQTQLRAEAREELDKRYSGMDKESHIAEFLTEEYFELNEQLTEQNEIRRNSIADIDTYTAAVESGTAALEDNKKNLDDTTAAVDKLSEAQESGVAASEQNSGAVGDVTSRLRELASAHQDTYAAALDSINGQISLFDSFAAEVSADTDTVEEMMARWAEQTQNLAQYTENLQKAAVYGIDEGLVASLSDGSAESAGYLATIIADIESAGGSMEGMSAAADEAVNDINASFGENLQIRQNFADTQTAITEDYGGFLEILKTKSGEVDFSGLSTSLTTATADLAASATTAGSNFGAGLASGIGESVGAVMESATAVAQAAITAANAIMGIASPSTVMYEAGMNYGLGLAGGITDSSLLVIEAATLFSTQLNQLMQQGAELSVTSFITKFAEIQTKTNAELVKLKATVTLATAPLVPQMKTLGVDMMNGLISGVNSRSGALYTAMSSVITKAIAAARIAADSSSPSKKTEALAVDIDEGFIVGFEKTREKVAASLRKVVDASLNIDVAGSINQKFSGINSFDVGDLDRIAPSGPITHTTVNLYPQNLSNDQLDYIFEKFNVRMGDETGDA